LITSINYDSSDIFITTVQYIIIISTIGIGGLTPIIALISRKSNIDDEKIID